MIRPFQLCLLYLMIILFILYRQVILSQWCLFTHDKHTLVGYISIINVIPRVSVIIQWCSKYVLRKYTQSCSQLINQLSVFFSLVYRYTLCITLIYGASDKIIYLMYNFLLVFFAIASNYYIIYKSYIIYIQV